jgi:hypothetical protein
MGPFAAMLSGGGISQLDRANPATPTHHAASRPASCTPQPLSDSRNGMVRTEGADQSIDIEFDRVGALVADGQEGVALSDMGEGGGHGFTMGRFQ